MSTILVAGAAGLLGAVIAERLAERGEEVVLADILDDSGDGHAVKRERAARLDAKFGTKITRVDLTDPAATDELVSAARPWAIVNAALFDPSGPGVRVLLAAARPAEVKLFVHLSDADLYPAPSEPGRRAREDERLDTGESFRSRAGEEEAVRDSGLPFVVFRVFELLGDDPAISRFPRPELEALLTGEAIVEPDGEPRDFLHVEDAARGVLRAMEVPPAGDTLNLGSGVGMSPRAIVEGLGKRLGAKLSYVPGPPRWGRPARIADMERVWSVLGFAPHHGAERAIDEILRGRMKAERREPPPRPAPTTPPGVSRRELFGLFRRPR